MASYDERCMCKDDQAYKKAQESARERKSVKSGNQSCLSSCLVKTFPTNDGCALCMTEAHGETMKMKLYVSQKILYLDAEPTWVAALVL